MNARLLLVLVAVTLLGLGGAFVLLGDDEPPREEATPAAETPEEAPASELPQGSELPEGVADDESLPQAQEEREAEAIPGSEITPAQIVGRVLDGDGAPRADVTVASFRLSKRTAFLRYRPTGQETTTDGDGRFRLVGVPTGEALALEVLTDAFAPTLVQPIEVAEAEVYDAGDVRLDTGVRLFGRVLDVEQRPVEGATLRVTDSGRATLVEGVAEPTAVAEVVTDAEGRYEIPHLGRSQYTVRIEATGYAALESVISFMIQGKAGQWEQDYLIEQADRVLAGSALGPSGAGVAGAKIKLIRRVPNSNTYYALEQLTDADGRFRFESMADGRYELSVESAGWYLPKRKKLECREDHVIRLQPAIVVHGQLSVSGEMPRVFTVNALPDARTGARVLEGKERSRTFEVSDGSGRFSYDGLRPGTYRLEVQAPGYAVTASQDLVLGSETPEVEVVIPLRAGGTIVGRVSDQRAGVLIELRDGDWVPNNALEFAFPSRPVHGLVTRTDASGAFRLQHVPAGRYVLTAKGLGLPDTHVRDVELGDGDLVDLGVVRRQPGGVVAGTVLDAQGNPAGGASVKLDGETMHRQVTAGVRGRFRMESVPPGEYTLSATPATFFDAFKFHVEEVVEVKPGKEVKVDLQLAARKGAPR